MLCTCDMRRQQWEQGRVRVCVGVGVGENKRALQQLGVGGQALGAREAARVRWTVCPVSPGRYSGVEENLRNIALFARPEQPRGGVWDHLEKIFQDGHS